MPVSTALLTDHYEFTMLDAALQSGTAHRQCVFEVFGRRLPTGRGYFVNAGTGRLLDLIGDFAFGPDELEHLSRTQVVSPGTLDWLAEYRFTGDIEGYPEGELFFPGSPLMTLRTDFATGVILETLVLSVLNHDVAVASAASRMWVQARGRTLIEMGSRRAHEQAAVAAARAAWIAGFDTTSNVEAGRSHGIPTAGTAAHSFTLLHDDERAAFAAQVAALGVGTTLLVDTFDTMTGIANALAVAGRQLGAIRLDSGDLGMLAGRARAVLDAAGATDTRILASSDLDEYAIAELADAPVDSYGVGTSVVTGSGSPAAGLVFKVVAVDGHPVAKTAASGKTSMGGQKQAARRIGADGVATAELVWTGSAGLQAPEALTDADRRLVAPLVRAGVRVDTSTLADARARHAAAVAELPELGRALRSPGAAIPTLRV
ncbi:MAG: nicotinate phosphoribosyltransferase [Candidatus Nanopelagicales bacterium]